MNRFFVVALLAFASCVDSPYQGPLYDPQACDDFVVLQQFGLGWGLLNHRISTWDVRLDDDECRAERAEIVHIGGDFSTGDSPTGTDDVPFVKVGWQRADTNVEQVGVARVSIDATVGPDGRVDGTTTYRRTELDLRHYPRVVAIIDGIGFETGVEQTDEYPEEYDPAHGYTIRGFGAGVEVESSSVNEITLGWDFHFQVENSPDRPKHNAAVEFARVGARIDVLLVGVRGAAVHERNVDYEMSYPPPVPLEDQQIDPPDPSKTAIEIDGEDGGPNGIWGISRFDFQYAFDGSCENDRECIFADTCADDGYCTLSRDTPGEYLREVTVTLRQDAYDRESGVGAFTLEGYTSNASRFVANFALEYTFSGGMVWIQAEGGGTAEQVEEEFETGEHTVPLD